MRGISFLCQGGYTIIRPRNFKMLETLNQGLFYTQLLTVHLLPISPQCSLHQIICFQSSQKVFYFIFYFFRFLQFELTNWLFHWLSAISIIYLIVQSKSKFMCMTVSVSRWAFTDPPTKLPAELMAQLTLLGFSGLSWLWHWPLILFHLQIVLKNWWAILFAT